MKWNDAAQTFVGYGAAANKDEAQRAAWLHVAGQIHLNIGLEQFLVTAYDQQKLTNDVLKREKYSKTEIYDYCAAYNSIPQFGYRRIPRNRHYEITVAFPAQNIKVCVRHRDIAVGDVLACLLFKQQAEKWHAENADTNLQVKNVLSLNTSNAKQFFELCKSKRKISSYDVLAPQIKSSVARGLHSLQAYVDGEPLGEAVHAVSKKTAESLAYFVAAMKLRETEPDMFSDFIKALKAGKGEVLKPIPPIWFRTRWDYLQPMLDTISMVRRVGIPQEYSDTSTQNLKIEQSSKGRSFVALTINPESLNRRSSELEGAYLRYQNDPTLEQMRTTRADLPMNQHAAKVLDLVKNNPVSIVVGATGSGKTSMQEQTLFFSLFSSVFRCIDQSLAQVPQILFEDAIKAGEGASCNIICTQPRRIAATSVAERVAAERNEALRQTIGYHVRFDAKAAPPQGSINFCTTGILLQQLRSDSEAALRGISHIIIDEVHERDVQIDFLMVLLKRVMKQREQSGLPPIKIVLMSATMNTELFAGYFAFKNKAGTVVNCPSISVPGRTFPVTEYYLDEITSLLRSTYGTNELSLLKDRDTQEYLEIESNYRSRVLAAQPRSGSSLQCTDIPEDDNFIDWKRKSLVGEDGELVISNDREDGLNPVGLVVTVIAHLAKTTQEGDVLVFLPGLAEIQAVNEMLKTGKPLGVDFRNSDTYRIDILHSSLPQQQMEVFHANAAGKRKIILSTNIAETSVTIPEVRYVVDSGKLREKRYEQTSRITKLQCTWVSKSNSKQRAGRAGRVRNGHYFALFTRERSRELRPSGLPEILRSDLQEICLDIKAQGFKDPIAQFLSEAIEPPSVAAIEAALSQLRGLGAFEKDESLTNLGKVLATMPVEPSLGKMILLGVIFKCLDPMIILGAASGGRDLFVTPLEKKREAQAKKKAFARGTGSDHMSLINAFREWRIRRDNENMIATARFVDESFLHRGALRTLDQTANQIEEILVTEGIIPFLPRTQRFRGEYGHPRLNDNSSSVPLIKALSLAGSYPNVAVPTGGLGYRTMEENFVMVHPGSTTYCGRGRDVQMNLPRDTVVSFGSKAKSIDGKSTYMRDVTQNTILNAMLFGGKPTQSGNTLIFDGWIPVSISDDRVLKVVLQFRLILDKVLGFVFQNLSTRKTNSDSANADEQLRNLVSDGILGVLEKDNPREGTMHSPAKRTKLSTFNDEFYSPRHTPKTRSTHIIRRDFSASVLNSTRISRGPAHVGGAPRKEYLTESDKLNTLRDSNQTLRDSTVRDPVSKYSIEKLPPRQQRSVLDYEGAMSTERGMRLSRTPPPLSVDSGGLNEVPLPPTPEPPRDRSPGTIRKEREEIFGSGKRKTKRKHGATSHDSSSEQSLGLPKTNSARSTEAPSYYPNSTARIKDKFSHTYIEHREAIRREIQILEDELIIERRKISIKKYSLPTKGTTRDITGFISQCLVSNDRATRTVTSNDSESEPEYSQVPSALPLEVSNPLHGLTQFCRLSFASNATNPYQGRRVFKGYSHQSLLHFQILVDVLVKESPTIEKLHIECSDWGLPELGHTLRKFSRERNVSKVVYAISSFSELAQARAELWAGLRHQFSQFAIPEKRESARLPGISNLNGSRYNRRKIVENLPKRSITFRGRNTFASNSIDTELSLGWHIHFDATGEARSNIFANVKVLSHVLAIDEAKTEQVSTLLNMLVAEYGILEGTSKLLAAFFHDD
ncbi:ATPdependent RNA helicase [Drechslerella dactyloides]|uniref:RNA helicase n=1 Tax=Drechslerella dactyloides TaxID=74499 RepID=A0AAD6NFF7_DREDA|nr:ATPdependent RNA helicase [Drechslerella dactyloides]